MKAKPIIIILLLVIITGGVIYFVAGKREGESTYQQMIAKTEEPLVIDPKYKLVIYSVSDEEGCADCKKMGDYAQEMLNKQFSAMLNSGQVEFYKITLGEPQSQPVITQYNIQKKGIILVRTGGDLPPKVRKLENATTYAESETALTLYLNREIKSIINAG